MIKIQLNSSVVVRISSTEAIFYSTSDVGGETYELPFLTIPSHQISRINDLIKGLQMLSNADPKANYEEFKRSTGNLLSKDIQNH